MHQDTFEERDTPEEQYRYEAGILALIEALKARKAYRNSLRIASRNLTEQDIRGLFSIDNETINKAFQTLIDYNKVKFVEMPNKKAKLLISCSEQNENNLILDEEVENLGLHSLNKIIKEVGIFEISTKMRTNQVV